MKKVSAWILFLTSGLVALAAVTVLFGWFSHVLVLVQVFPDFSPMQFNTALCLLLLSITTLIVDTRYRKLGLAIAVLVLAFTTLTLAQYIFSTNFGIDTLFIQPFTQVKTTFIGRMAPNTAISLMLASAALFILARSTCSIQNYCALVVSILTALAFSIAILPLLGYAAKIENLTFWAGFTQMALHTAVCVLLLCINIFTQAWNRSSNRIFWSPAALGFTGVVISIALSLALRSQSDFNLHEYLSEEANHFAATATIELREATGALERVRQRWEASQGTPKKLWLADAANYHSDISFITSMVWIDAQGRLQWIIPSKTGASIRNALEHNRQIAAAMGKAQSSRLSQTISKLTLANDNYFLYISPLYHSNHADGYLITFLSTKQFVANVSQFTHTPLGPLFIELRDADILLFSNLDAKTAAELPSLAAWQKSAEIANNTQTWQVTMTPSSELLDKPNQNTSWAILLTGFFMSILGGFSLFFALKWQNNSLALVAAQELNNAILASSTYLIIAVDPEGQVILFNKQAEESLGYQASEVINKATPLLWHDKDEIERRAKELSKELGKPVAADFAVFSTKALAEGGETREWTFIRKDGSRFPGLLVTTSLNYNRDKVVGFVGIINDLSQQKEMERVLPQYNEDLKRSNQALEAFAYAASHDLKAPLRVIDNASKWLQEDLKEHLSGENLENMVLLRSRVKRMEKLLDDLLAYSRVGRITDEHYLEIVNGKELITDILELLNPPAGFKIEINPKFYDIKINRMPLKQIILNLINNAIKHHESQTGVISLDVIDEGDHYVFSVRDDGPGIPPEFHDEVFKMLRTLKPRDQVEGSGMGLAMVKKYIEVYGGEIRIEPNHPRGAVFKFIWPKQQQLKEKMV